MNRKNMFLNLKKNIKIRVLFILILSLQYTGVAQEFLNLDSKSSFIINGTSTYSDWSVKAVHIEGILKLSLRDTTNNLANYISNEIDDILLQVSVDSLQSGKGETMDNKMHGALKKEVYPKIYYNFISINSPIDKKNGYVISGLINIAGVEKQIEINSVITLTNNIVHFSGKKKLKLTEFNINPPTAMFGQIETGNDIVITFDLFFTSS